MAQNRDSKEIDSLALNKGYQVLSDIKVSADQPMLTQGIENSRSLVKWAMSAKPGEVSDITGVVISGYLSDSIRHLLESISLWRWSRMMYVRLYVMSRR